MCLSTQALMLFLSLLPEDRIETAPDRITIRADVRTAIWTANGDRWCTNAPQLDAAIRLGQGDPA